MVNRLLLLLQFVFVADLCLAQDLFINEIMQSNTDCYYAEHDFPDSWVEIYNSTSKEIKLENYCIGQTSDVHSAFKLATDAVVPAKGFLLISCDKKGAKLHTDFRLESVNAGDIYLFNPSGVLVDHLSYPAMPAINVSYGRVSDGGSEWGWQLTATPKASNQGGVCTKVLPEPIFSKSGSVLSSATTITLTMPSGSLPSDTKIYATTDGTEPTLKSQSGTSLSFSIKESTVIRAKLISKEALSRTATTNSYIFHHTNTNLPIISIAVDESYLYDDQKGILSSTVTVLPEDELCLYSPSDFTSEASIHNGQENFFYNWRRPVNVEMLNAGKEGLSFNQLSEVAAAGWASRLYNQKSIKLHANKRFGKKRFTGRFWPEKSIDETKSIMIRNGGQNSNISRINDALLQRLFGTHVNALDYQAYRPVVLYINGKYSGVYGLRERSNEDFVESNYNGLEDIELATQRDYNAETAENEAFKAFYTLYHNKSVTFNQLSQVMDVNNFRQTVIAELFSVNYDYPHNNVSMWKPKGSNGKWRWILKDVDLFARGSWSAQLPFNMFKYLSKTATTKDVAEYHYSSKDRVKDPLALYQKMFTFTQFTDTLIDQFSTYLGDFLKPSVTVSMLTQMSNEIKNEIKPTFNLYNAEPNFAGNIEQGYNTYKEANYNRYIDTIKWHCERRPRIIYKQMADFFKLGTVVPMTLHRQAAHVKINGVALTEGDFDGAYYSNRKLQISAGIKNAHWKMKKYYRGKSNGEVSFDTPEISLYLKDYTNCDSVSFDLQIEKTEFDLMLDELAINTSKCKDLSSSLAITIAEPNYAYANISCVDELPNGKYDNLNAYIDFYDNAGNYFRKKILLNKQGNSDCEKKNLSIQFCEDEWLGETTPDIVFGNWVAQDEFHLKGFYDDGLRGTAEVAYQLYSQITKRSNGYPKAFPLSLYVNGEFYGIMAWQLKKHRDNMGLDKKTDTNIWLDGTINDKQIFAGTIGWEKIEVRNPKDIYNVDGTLYDGDFPMELMGSDSPAYDATKGKMVRTANAKQHIIELSKYCAELSSLKSKGTTTDKMRAAIKERFDVDELINYKVFSLVTNNYDGFSKNWQWFTYDGKKWTVAPYDCNLTFGYNEDATSLWPAEQSSKKYDYEMLNTDAEGPMLWIKDYFWDDIKTRYTSLRESGVISVSNIMTLVYDWNHRIGDENYSLEWKRWPDCPCVKSFVDSPSRFEEWITNRIALEDLYMGYAAPQSTYELAINETEWATICVPFDFSIPEDMKVYTVSGVAADGNTLLIDQAYVTKANNPYLVNAPKGVYSLSGETVSNYTDLKNGLLTGTYTDSFAPAGSYVLQNNKVYGLGFYRVSTANTIPMTPYHAYMTVSNGAKQGHFRLQDSVVGISDIEQGSDAPAKTYNYWGQEIRENASGFQLRQSPDGSFQKIIVIK